MAVKFYRCRSCSKKWQDPSEAVGDDSRCPDCGGKLVKLDAWNGEKSVMLLFDTSEPYHHPRRPADHS